MAEEGKELEFFETFGENQKTESKAKMSKEKVDKFLNDQAAGTFGQGDN